MLYGMEDYEYNEFSLMKKNKLNIKKIVLLIVVILVCIFLVCLGISISYNKDDGETKVYSVDEKNDVLKEQVATVVVKNEIDADKKENKEEKSLFSKEKK